MILPLNTLLIIHSVTSVRRGFIIRRQAQNHQPLLPAETALLALLRRALFSFDDVSSAISSQTEWKTVLEEAELHTVLPLTLEAAMTLPQPLQPSEDIFQWFRDNAILRVHRNEQLMAAQDKLLKALERDGVACVVLKGSSASATYPRPELRILGDIDILVDRGALERASISLQGLGYKQTDDDGRFHIGFVSQSTHVELHFECTFFPENQAGRALRDVMAGAVTGSRTAHLESYAFPVLSPEQQVVSLLMHMQSHMKLRGIDLRHLCDYVMYVYRLPQDEWEQVIVPILRQGGLLRFAQVLAKTCVLWLGLPESSVSWCDDVEESDCRELLTDFLCSGNFGQKQPSRLASSYLSADKSGAGAHPFIPITVIRNLNHYARRHYSIVRKVPLFLPFFWVMLPLQYLRGIVKSKGDPAILETLSSARRRRKLFAQLRIFETDQRR